MNQNLGEKKIALFIPSLMGGGAERVMVSLANGLANRGFSIDLILVKKEGVFLSEVSSKIRIIDLRRNRALRAILPLTIYLKNERPYAVISALNYANLIAIGSTILSGTKPRLIITEHTTLSKSINNIAKLPLRRIFFWAIKGLYSKADQIVAVSCGVANDLVETLGIAKTNVRTIFNPIELAEIKKKSQVALANPWGAEDKTPIIIGVGRLNKAKDFPTLICAFNILRASMKARLLILGEGSERKTLMSLICKSPYSKDILLAGYQSNPYNWIRLSSVFVLSSQWEGFGNVLVEAMACGVPIVSTACPNGPSEILENGKWGRLVPVGNPLRLSLAIKATILDTIHPEVTHRADHFSIENAINAYMDILY